MKTARRLTRPSLFVRLFAAALLAGGACSSLSAQTAYIWNGGTGNWTDGTLTINTLAGFGAGRYDLIDYTGTLTNNGLALGTTQSGYTYRIDTSIAGQVDLVVTNAVPEPSTWAAVLAGTGFLVVTLRRRTRG